MPDETNPLLIVLRELEKVNGNIATLGRKVDKMYDETNSGISRLETRIGSLESRMGMMETKMEGLQGRVDRVYGLVETSQKTICDNINDFKVYVDNLSAKVENKVLDVVSPRFAAVIRSIDEVKDTVNFLRSEFAEQSFFPLQLTVIAGGYRPCN